jgi:hypothetical protein
VAAEHQKSEVILRGARMLRTALGRQASKRMEPLHAERRTAHIAELRKRTAEAEAKLKRL